MKKRIPYMEARKLVVTAVTPVEKEIISLENCFDRIIAQNIIAAEHVPPFDRSPYDGYAFRACDVHSADADTPVTLRVLEAIPAGGVSHMPVTEGTAVKILTGAPIPEGADAVIMFEKTQFTDTSVTIFEPVKKGSNIIYTGEDIQKGTVLAESGTVIDAGLAGTLASQNIPSPLVYRIPKVGIISTGSELLEVGSPLEPGKIYNSNYHTLSTALQRMGCEPVYLGISGDRATDISSLIDQGLHQCDALILTGGVSVGDHDLTPAAMRLSGVDLLFEGVDLKPGMACAYGVKNGKLVCGLSGNPASSITNFYAVAYPALRKLCGHRQVLPREIEVTLTSGFAKKSPGTRLLRGRLDLTDGTVRMHLPKDQGNVVLSSTIGCDVMAIVPAGSDALCAGTKLKGFLL